MGADLLRMNWMDRMKSYFSESDKIWLDGCSMNG